jgi:hypothetical protein
MGWFGHPRPVKRVARPVKRVAPLAKMGWPATPIVAKV